jgi:signal peptidase II
LIPALIAAVAALLLDQLTKWLIVEFVMPPPQLIPVTPFFNLTLGYNPGISFGLFGSILKEWPNLFAVTKIAVVIGLFWWASTLRSRLEAAAVGLIAGGASGNIIDRMRQGAVTDFLDFHASGWHWPTFNLADVAIVLGVTVLLAASLGMIGQPQAREAGEQGASGDR